MMTKEKSYSYLMDWAEKTCDRDIYQYVLKHIGREPKTESEFWQTLHKAEKDRENKRIKGPVNETFRFNS